VARKGLSELKPPVSLVLRRHTAAIDSIYKGIPALGERDVAMVPDGKPIFTTRISKPYRPVETYLLGAVDADNVQTHPVPVELKLYPPALQWGSGISVIYAAGSGGISMPYWFPFLDETLSLRLEPYVGFFGHGEVGLVGGVLLDLFGLVRTCRGDAESNWMLFEIGAGANLRIRNEHDNSWLVQLRPAIAVRAGGRIRSGLGDSGQEYRLGVAAWSALGKAKLADQILQLFFEFANH
jgi:hypothetical protein